MSTSNVPGTINGTVIYHYTPSLGLAVCFCTTFGISTVLHTYQTTRSKSWYMIPIILGGICETTGYVGRILGAGEAPEYTLGPYIVQAILLLIAPALIAASIYMILGHIIRATDGDRYSLIRERILTKLFVLGDFMGFMIQSTGAGMLTNKDPEKKNAANYIIIGGLVIQLLFFGFFMLVAILFWARLSADRPRSSQLKVNGIKWRLHTTIVFVCSTLIMIRSVFRVIEYAQGQDGILLTHEMYLYIFDAALMFLSVLILNVVHPSRISALNNGGRAIKRILGTEVMTEKAVVAKGQNRNDEEATQDLTGEDFRFIH